MKNTRRWMITITRALFVLAMAFLLVSLILGHLDAAYRCFTVAALLWIISEHLSWRRV